MRLSVDLSHCCGNCEERVREAWKEFALVEQPAISRSAEGGRRSQGGVVFQERKTFPPGMRFLLKALVFIK